LPAAITITLADPSSTVGLTVSLLHNYFCALYSSVDQWALIELSRHPDVQTRLREELLAFGPDPTYDQLKANLPYLDAVVHETLRLHPPVPESTRLVSLYVYM
jgi:Cytochrome P450